MSEADEIVEEWRRYARDDLTAARALAGSDAVQPRHVCFWAQQAAEKAIKSLYVAAQVPFAFIHDLEKLVGKLPEGHSIDEQGLDLAWLSQWAVEPRYPPVAEPDREEALRAVALAEQIVYRCGAT